MIHTAAESIKTMMAVKMGISTVLALIVTSGGNDDVEENIRTTTSEGEAF